MSTGFPPGVAEKVADDQLPEARTSITAELAEVPTAKQEVADGHTNCSMDTTPAGREAVDQLVPLPKEIAIGADAVVPVAQQWLPDVVQAIEVNPVGVTPVLLVYSCQVPLTSWMISGTGGGGGPRRGGGG